MLLVLVIHGEHALQLICIGLIKYVQQGEHGSSRLFGSLDGISHTECTRSGEF